MKLLKILKKERFMINMEKRVLNKKSNSKIQDKDLVGFQEVETSISILEEAVEVVVSMTSSLNSLEAVAVEAVQILVVEILVEVILEAVLMASNKNKRRLTSFMRLKWK